MRLTLHEPNLDFARYIFEQEVFMKKLIRHLMNFLKNGFRVFSASSQGQYNERSTPIKEFREEMLHSSNRSIRSDKENLKKDQIGRASCRERV